MPKQRADDEEMARILAMLSREEDKPVSRKKNRVGKKATVDKGERSDTDGIVEQLMRRKK